MNSTSVWAQYTIRLAPGRRDALAAALKAQGIPTAIYYAKPLHRQAAYRALSRSPMAALPVSERLAEEVISLPMHAYLEAAGPGSHHRGGAAGARELQARSRVVPRAARRDPCGRQIRLEIARRPHCAGTSPEIGSTKATQ